MMPMSQDSGIAGSQTLTRWILTKEAFVGLLNGLMWSGGCRYDCLYLVR